MSYHTLILKIRGIQINKSKVVYQNLCINLQAGNHSKNKSLRLVLKCVLYQYTYYFLAYHVFIAPLSKCKVNPVWGGSVYTVYALVWGIVVYISVCLFVLC